MTQIIQYVHWVLKESLCSPNNQEGGKKYAEKCTAYKQTQFELSVMKIAMFAMKNTLARINIRLDTREKDYRT